MLIEINQLTKQISDLKKQRNSLFARIETLKLRGPNRDQQRIEAKQQQLLELEEKLKSLEDKLL